MDNFESSIWTRTYQSMIYWIPRKFPNRIFMGLKLFYGSGLLSKAWNIPLSYNTFSSCCKYSLIISTNRIYWCKMFSYSHSKSILIPNFEQTIFSTTQEKLSLPTEGPYWVKMWSHISFGDPCSRFRNHDNRIIRTDISLIEYKHLFFWACALMFSLL